MISSGKAAGGSFELDSQLKEAVQAGDVNKAKRLMSEGASPLGKHQVIDNENFLHHAVSKNNPDMLALLLANGLVDYSSPKGAGKSALRASAKHPKCLSVFLSHLNNKEENRNNAELGYAFLDAIHYNHVDMVKACISANVSPNAFFADTLNNALHVAVRGRWVSILPLLIAAGVSLEHINKDGQTPLAYARAVKFEEGIKLLSQPKKESLPVTIIAPEKKSEEKPVDFNDKPEVSVYTDSIVDAVRNCDVEQVRYLLSAGAKLKTTHIIVENGESYSLLHWAVKQNKPELVRLLMINKADYDTCQFDKDKRTPLGRAFYVSDDCVKAFLGIPGVNYKSAGFQMSLSYAVMFKKTEVVKSLVAAGVPLNELYVNTQDNVLHEAVKANHEELVRILYKAGVNIAHKNKDGLTPVQLAVKNKNSNLVAILTGQEEKQNVTPVFEKPVVAVKSTSVVQAEEKSKESKIIDAIREQNISALSSLLGNESIPAGILIDGMNCLHWAVTRDNPLLVRFLLEHHAPHNVYNKGLNPCRAAANAEKWGCVKEFLQFFKKDKTIDLGSTYLETLCQCGDVNLIDDFIVSGVNLLKSFNNTKQNALHVLLVNSKIAVSERKRLITILLNAGVNPNQKDRKGKTPLDIARSHSLQVLVDTIVQYKNSNTGFSKLELNILKQDYSALLADYKYNDDISRALTIVGPDIVNAFIGKKGKSKDEGPLQNCLDSYVRKDIRVSFAELFQDIQSQKFSKDGLELMAKSPLFKKRLLAHIKSLPELERFEILNDSVNDLENHIGIIWRVQRGSKPVSITTGTLGDVFKELRMLKSKGCEERLKLMKQSAQTKKLESSPPESKTFMIPAGVLREIQYPAGAPFIAVPGFFNTVNDSEHQLAMPVVRQTTTTTTREDSLIVTPVLSQDVNASSTLPELPLAPSFYPAVPGLQLNHPPENTIPTSSTLVSSTSKTQSSFSDADIFQALLDFPQRASSVPVQENTSSVQQDNKSAKIREAFAWLEALDDIQSPLIEAPSDAKDLNDSVKTDASQVAKQKEPITSSQKNVNLSEASELFGSNKVIKQEAPKEVATTSRSVTKNRAVVLL